MTVLVAVATGAVGLLAVGVYAVVRGPTIYDRFVAVAQATVVTLILLVLFGFISGRPSLYLDIALIYGLLALVVPIALSTSYDRASKNPSRDGPTSPSARDEDATSGRNAHNHEEGR